MFVSGLRADERDTRHGSLVDGWKGFRIEGGLTLTSQTLPHDGATQIAASVDLLATVPAGPGTWTLYLEGASTPPHHSHWGRIPQANADVGTAMDGRGRGRLQLSEVHYGMHTASAQWLVGLLDPSTLIDLSRTANDETAQFLAAPLVNDPSIAFPDYTPGIALHVHATDYRPGLTLALTSTHGLLDNGGRYPRTFRLGETGKGAFLASELYREGTKLAWRVGAWLRTDPQPVWQAKGTAHARGVYGVLDLPGTGGTDWSLRLGTTLDRVSEIHTFLSLAMGGQAGAWHWGLGAARTERRTAVEWLAEGYARLRIGETVSLGPHVQWIRLPGSYTGWTAGLRLVIAF